MGKIAIIWVVMGAFLFSAVIAFGQQREPVDVVADGCSKEIGTYCKSVTVGQGRILACLYAYEDKLSNRCDYALYEASAQLERALTALTYLASPIAMKGSEIVEMNVGNVHAIGAYKSKWEGEQNEKDEHVSGDGLLCGVSWRDRSCPKGAGWLQEGG